MRSSVVDCGKGRWLRLTVPFVFLVFLMCIVIAKAQDSRDKVKIYVGPLSGAPSSSRIAVVTEGDLILAYICSGDPTFNVLYSRWLKGTLSNAGEVSAAAADGLKLAGRLKGDLLEGTLAPPTEKALVFRAKELPPRGIAGLYRAERKTAETESVFGWIIDPDHAVVGAAAKKNKGKTTLTPPKPPVVVTTATAKKKLPPAPRVINDKQQGELDNLAAEAVQETLADQVVIQGQRVKSVTQLPQGIQKR